MSAFIAVFLTAFWLGIIDFFQKGKEQWDKVSKFKKSAWWPLMFFGIWTVIIILLSLKLNNWWYLLGIPLFIDQDAGYYVTKMLWFKFGPAKTYWNSWLKFRGKPIFNSARSYWLTVLFINIIVAGIYFGLETAMELIYKL